jgi:outer membrane protein TolC
MAKGPYCAEGCESYLPFATEIEYPDSACAEEEFDERPLAPRSAKSAAPMAFWDLTLDEAVELALQGSDVLRELGVRVVSTPDSTATIYDPAIRETDPLFGVQGALSQFDTQLSTSLFWQNNDRVFNNRTLGGGVNQFRQDLSTFQFGFTKTAATGTEMSIQNLTIHDANNAGDNLFGSSWDTQFLASVRHPLMQGGGVEFNRIAGPNAQPGFRFSSGVLIARVDTDVALADFEAGVRDFLAEVEDAYWELYFAYRELDSKKAARDSALETWRITRAKYAQGLEGGEALNEARAREQYYMLQDQVEDALSGAAAGSRSVGVYRGERALRRLLGLPVNDGRLMRPAAEPSMAPVEFSWETALAESLHRRVELRRQRWRIRRRELELVASRNFTLPRLDAVAQYRVRGFGDDLTGSGPPFRSAFQDLRNSGRSEWEVGLQVDVPLGYRQAWAAVRNAELRLARETAVLDEQKQQITHDLADALAELHRAYAAVRNGFNRLAAAKQHLDATAAAFQADRVTVDLLLDAQERLSLAQSRFQRSLTDYALAQTNVHLQKGSLLAYNGVLLSEGPWSARAHQDARETARRWRPRAIPYPRVDPAPLSVGPFPQPWEPTNQPLSTPSSTVGEN